jgi:hypothetical protein
MRNLHYNFYTTLDLLVEFIIILFERPNVKLRFWLLVLPRVHVPILQANLSTNLVPYLIYTKL